MSNPTPEKIYGWQNTQLSVARHWGRIKYNGAEYRIDYDSPEQPLVLVQPVALKAKKEAPKS